MHFSGDGRGRVTGIRESNDRGLILVQFTGLVVIIINVSKIHSLGKHF